MRYIIILAILIGISNCKSRRASSTQTKEVINHVLGTQMTEEQKKAEIQKIRIFGPPEYVENNAANAASAANDDYHILLSQISGDTYEIKNCFVLPEATKVTIEGKPLNGTAQTLSWESWIESPISCTNPIQSMVIAGTAEFFAYFESCTTNGDVMFCSISSIPVWIIGTPPEDRTRTFLPIINN